MLNEYFQSRTETMLATLRTLVEHESPSTDQARLEVLATHLAELLQARGAQVERMTNLAGGDHLLARFAPAGTPDGPPALIVCHYDTVHGVGSLERMPFRVEGDAAFGPGIYDMKAGITLALEALEAITTLALPLPRPIVVLITSDEETGSRTSRALIEEIAKGAAFALIMEPPIEQQDALKTSRKGIGHFAIEIEGVPAHAGVEPEKGVSAITELAHQVLFLHGLNDREKGTTVNVGVVSGGTRSNVVAAHARLDIDARAWTGAEAERVAGAILGVQGQLAGAKLNAKGAFERPPMERSPAIIELFGRAQTIAGTLGMTLHEGGTGGGSDGNFTAAIGTPTLDGLGVPGKGAHADHEQIRVSGLAERAALLTALLAGL
jgi:glutamate carboxypeptidase